MSTLQQYHDIVVAITDLFTPHKQVKAWPGKQFIIQLTGMDQFKRQTIFAARFTLTNHSSVCLMSTTNSM